MINEKLYEKIRAEGKKRDYKLGNSGYEYDEKGNIIFVIRLLPIGNRLAKIIEQKREKELENNNQHDGGGSFCMCNLCQEVRKQLIRN